MAKVARSIPDSCSFSIPGGPEYTRIKSILAREKLRTVCIEARCPNIGDCMCRGTATFLLMGPVCTRNCRYCAVEHGAPGAPDPGEPRRVARAVGQMGLDYAVITSVTRDDLPDGGAGIFAETVRLIREISPGCRVELLVPDFLHADNGALARVLGSRPDVLNHNIEVAGSLFEKLRPMGDYRRSLEVLRSAAEAGYPAKSGFMVGFGESERDVYETMRDLRDAGCSLLTVGQYLRSSREGFPVHRYYEPAEFEEIRKAAAHMGFAAARCGAMVRSSYHAEELAGC